VIKIQVSVFLLLSSLIGFSQASPCSKSIDSLLTIGSALSFSEPDSSFYYFDKSEIYSRQCKYDLGLTRSKNFKGLYFALKGEYEKASELYFEGIEIAQKNQLDSEEAIIKNNLGALYFDLNEFEKAKSYYEESLSKMIELQDSVWIGIIYTNLAGVYFMKE
jgi:tetratricopeptide (TPR) repeat protein